MTTATLRFDDAIYEQIKELADFQGLTPTTFMRNAILEQLEDEQDYQEAIQVLRESNGESVSRSEIMKRLEKL
ncbi:type II toxin-antitoxin system RelB family antitoxin [Lactovum odontotermitis]